MNLIGSIYLLYRPGHLKISIRKPIMKTVAVITTNLSWKAPGYVVGLVNVFMLFVYVYACRVLRRSVNYTCTFFHAKFQKKPILITYPNFDFGFCLSNFVCQVGQNPKIEVSYQVALRYTY